MTKQPVEGQLLLDYLLGILPEVETERLDELSVTDDEFAGQLNDVENDLVDAYVSGELSGDALARFRSHYLASSRRREKVAFAQTLRGTLEKARTLEDGNENSIQRAPGKSRRWLHFPFTQWGFAAAALLLFALGSYLMVENARLRSLVSQAQAEQRELRQREEELKTRIAFQRSSTDEAGKELARVQHRLAELEQQLAENGPQREVPASDVKLLAFHLSPQTRGISKIPSLRMSAETDFLALNLELDVKDFPAYRAALKDPRTGKIAWQSGRIEYDGTSSSMIIGLPATIVKPQNYVLELSGISARGAMELVSSYPFRVQMNP